MSLGAAIAWTAIAATVTFLLWRVELAFERRRERAQNQRALVRIAMGLQSGNVYPMRRPSKRAARRRSG